MEVQPGEFGFTLPPFGREHVVVRPGHCGGKPHIAGHRIKVQHIAVWHERLGLGPDEIVAEHPGLTLADVHAALTYYFDHRQQIDADIRADEEFAAGLRGASSLPPSLLVQRLAHGMAQAIRFHLDEVCDPRIAAGLRLRGVEVTTAAEVGLLGASDEEHLAYARGEGRVIVTHDADFLRLHGAGAVHAGIVFCPMQTRSLGEVIRLLALIWEILEPSEMRGHVEHL